MPLMGHAIGYRKDMELALPTPSPGRMNRGYRKYSETLKTCQGAMIALDKQR
jgi:hypothetical protein